MKYDKLITHLLFVTIFITGCSGHKIIVTPNTPKIDKNSTLNCKITYNGNKDYLPQNLIEDNKSSIQTSYTYKVQYVNGNTQLDALNLFNPLLIAGFSLSEENIIVDGKLEIKNNSQNSISFTSLCIATKQRTLYQNSGSTEPRRDCLLSIRDNINNQLINFINKDNNAIQ